MYAGNNEQMILSLIRVESFIYKWLSSEKSFFLGKLDRKFTEGQKSKTNRMLLYILTAVEQVCFIGLNNFSYSSQLQFKKPNRFIWQKHAQIQYSRSEG